MTAEKLVAEAWVLWRGRGLGPVAWAWLWPCGVGVASALWRGRGFGPVARAWLRKAALGVDAAEPEHSEQGDPLWDHRRNSPEAMGPN